MTFSNITDEKLHILLGMRIFTPDSPVFIEVPLADWIEKCPSELGDGRKLMNSQFYGVEYDDCVYVALARTNTHKLSNGSEIPNNNYQLLSENEFFAWVDFYGIDKVHVKQRDVITDEYI